jgi:hypothetical protein
VPNARCLAQTRLGRWINALGFLAALLLSAAGAVAEESLFSFDISAQPLAAALESYSVITGRDVLYNSNLAAGRHSNGVRGRFSADAALVLLLEGTGLSAEGIAQQSFVLSSAATAIDTSTPTIVAEYYGRIQTSLRTALCRDKLARPGNYRIAMRFRIDAGGALQQYQQFGTSGSVNVDEAIRDTVSQLRIGAAPPADLGQPVVMVILPLASGLTGCDGVAAAAQAR